MLTEDTDATRIPKADNTIVKAPNSKIKKNIYEVFGFICIILLIASCYMSGVEASYRDIPMSDTWGLIVSKSPKGFHFIIHWHIRSLIAMFWMIILISYPVSCFKAEGAIGKLFNLWGEDAPSNSAKLLIIAVIGSGLLVRTFIFAEDKPLGDGFWLMLCAILLQLLVALRLWRLSR